MHLPAWWMGSRYAAQIAFIILFYKAVGPMGHCFSVSKLVLKLRTKFLSTCFLYLYPLYETPLALIPILITIWSCYSYPELVL